MEKFSRVLATAWKPKNLILFSKKFEIEFWLFADELKSP